MSKPLPILITIGFLSLAISAIQPHDYFTWFLEVVPALLAFVILWVLYRRGYHFTDLVYAFVLIHALILIIGGHYTYAEVPLFNWLRDTFDLDRNYYDRIGHFAQGFVPALIAREVVIKNNLIKGRGWQFFFIIFTILGFSAFYEFFEWWVALATGEAADAFLGTQGDVWDTQWDMFLCLVGAISAFLTLSKIHDTFLATVSKKD